MRARQPIDVEVRGRRQRPNADHVWITHWHPVKGSRAAASSASTWSPRTQARKRRGGGGEGAARRGALSQPPTTSTVRLDGRPHRLDHLVQQALARLPAPRPRRLGWRKVHHPDRERVVSITRSFRTGQPQGDIPAARRDDGYAGSCRALPIRDGDGGWSAGSAPAPTLTERRAGRCCASSTRRSSIIRRNARAATDLERRRGTGRARSERQPAWTARWLAAIRAVGRTSDWLLRGRPRQGGPATRSPAAQDRARSHAPRRPFRWLLEGGGSRPHLRHGARRTGLRTPSRTCARCASRLGEPAP